MTTTTTKPKSVKAGGTCRHKCRGGNKCCLYAKPKHTLHCCMEPLCQCHDLGRVKS